MIEKEVLIKNLMLGLTLKEIAEKENANLSTVYYSIYRNNINIKEIKKQNKKILFVTIDYLRKKGVSYKKIGEELNMSKMRVYNLYQEFKNAQ